MKSRKIKPITRVLPPELVIPGADNHLYRIGLQLNRRSHTNRRNFFHNPYIVLLVIIQMTIRTIILIIGNNFTDDFLLAIGDFGYVMKCYKQLNMMVFAGCMICNLSMLHNLYNYINDIQCADIRIYQLLSGTVSPQQLGLNNMKSVLKFVNISRKMLRIALIMPKYIGKNDNYLINLFY